MSGGVLIRQSASVVGRGPDLRISAPRRALMNVDFPALNSPAITAENAEGFAVFEVRKVERVGEGGLLGRREAWRAFEARRTARDWERRWCWAADIIVLLDIVRLDIVRVLKGERV